jgi:hypothetical protein
MILSSQSTHTAQIVEKHLTQPCLYQAKTVDLILALFTVKGLHMMDAAVEGIIQMNLH